MNTNPKPKTRTVFISNRATHHKIQSPAYLLRFQCEIHHKRPYLQIKINGAESLHGPHQMRNLCSIPREVLSKSFDLMADCLLSPSPRNQSDQKEKKPRRNFQRFEGEQFGSQKTEGFYVRGLFIIIYYYLFIYLFIILFLSFSVPILTK